MVGNYPTHYGMTYEYGTPTTAWLYAQNVVRVATYSSTATNRIPVAAAHRLVPCAYSYPDSELSSGLPQWDEQALLTLLPFRRRFARGERKSAPWRRLARGIVRFAREVDHTRRRRDKR